VVRPGHAQPLPAAADNRPAARAIALAIAIRDGGWDLTGLDGTGIELVREPRTYHATAAT